MSQNIEGSVPPSVHSEDDETKRAAGQDSKTTFCFIVLGDSAAAAVRRIAPLDRLEFLPEQEIPECQGFVITTIKSGKRAVFADRAILGVIVDQDLVTTKKPDIERLRKLVPYEGSDAVAMVSKTDERDKLVNWILNRSFAFVDRFAKDHVAAQMELAALQRISRDQIEALEEAEAAIRREGAKTPKLGLHIPPSTSGASLASIEGAQIAQSSKREFRAVHAFDLNFRFANSRSVCRINVTLEGAYSGQKLGQWSLEERALADGWIRFDVPARKAPLDEAVRINIEWSAEVTPQLKLMLGEKVADEQLAASGVKEGYGNRPLAVRIYEGIPGVQLNSNALRASDPEDKPLVPEGIVSLDSMLSLTRFHSGPPGIDPQMVRYVDDDAGVLVHPSGRAPVVAVIDRVQVQSAVEFYAEVSLDHDEAEDTEFAIIAVPSKSWEPKVQAMIGSSVTWKNWFKRSPQNQAKFGGDVYISWLPLQRLQQGSVAYHCESVLSGPIDIFLMTRSVSGRSSYSWAHFKRLYVRQKSNLR